MNKNFIKYLPNMITCVRIVGTIAMLFASPLSSVFFVLYTISGLSDVADGTIARLMKTESEFGTKLDSVADICFYAVMIFKIFPILHEILPSYVWIMAVIAVAIRMVAYIVAAIKYRKFSSLHTYLNKLTGFLVFLVPYLVKLKYGIVYCTFLCSVAILASLEELVIHLFSSQYVNGKKYLNKKDFI